MSDEGKQILSLTRAVRKYLEDIGQLLSTAEGMLGKRGYIKIGDVAFPYQNSIKNPERWLPQDASRFFKNEENSHILAVISVIIDNLGKPDSFEQPIVSAAWFNCGEGNEVGGSWDYILSRIILSVQNFSLKGEMIDISPELFEEYKRSHNSQMSLKILSSQVLAVPLVDIQRERDIEERIIKPLDESLDKKIS